MGKLFINIILGLFLFTVDEVNAQDTTVVWLNNIDTSGYTIQYNKKYIPEEFYSIIGIEKPKEIANANKRFNKGCTDSGIFPHKRLNWIASDNHNHWILSISYGGYASGTKYYFIDKEKEKPNTNIFYFTGSNNGNLTFGETTLKLATKQFIRG
jgi:hypothetical protein